MTSYFADTFYWAALLNPRDQWHAKAREFGSEIENVRLVTTESVMIELLNYFSEFSPEMRQMVSETVRDILVDLDIEYIPHSSDSFLDALELYEGRSDKTYSLTDCISMLVMKSKNIQKVLTHDDHFEQEGFIRLF